MQRAEAASRFLQHGVCVSDQCVGVLTACWGRVDAWEGEPVSALKLALQKITGLAPTQQSLTFRFKELAPTLRLGTYNIPVRATICACVAFIQLMRGVAVAPTAVV